MHRDILYMGFYDKWKAIYSWVLINWGRIVITFEEKFHPRLHPIYSNLKNFLPTQPELL